MKNTTKTNLITHIQNLNAEKAAWVAEDPDNRWAGMWVENIQHWNSMDIFTLEDFELYNVKAEYYDLYKEVHGTRSGSRWVWDKELNVTFEEVRKALDLLEEYAVEKFEEDQNAEKEAIESFEKEISKMIELGAGTRDNAIRWFLQANSDIVEQYTTYGFEEFCWYLNIPTSYSKELQRNYSEELSTQY
jgi:hypothetical protein